jgi:phosphoribosylamine--glycine ligase
MVDRQFGAAGATVVIEECLTGPEVSFFVLADGLCAVPLGTAQDHKRIWDDDKGPNTGGMGAIAPSPLWTDSLERQVMLEVVEPVLAGMAAAGSPYRGFLYVSLMLTPSGPRVIEFNVRLGDPEAQVVLPLVDGSIASLLLAAATGTLRGLRAPVLRRAAVGVVLAARGYPGPVETGQPIRGIDAAGALPDVVVFHAATRAKDGELVTAGGRVLTVVAQAATLAAARARAYGAAALIQFDGMQFRRDIGRKALEGGT